MLNLTVLFLILALLAALLGAAGVAAIAIGIAKLCFLIFSPSFAPRCCCMWPGSFEIFPAGRMSLPQLTEYLLYMKNKPLVLLTLVLGGLAAGCGPSNSDNTNVSADTNSTLQTAKDYANAAVTNTEDAATNAWASMKASFQTAMGYSYDKKDEFVAATSDDLQTLDQKIKDLETRAASASDAEKADIQAKLNDLHGKRAVLDQKMANIKAASAADWDDAKASFKTAYDDTKSSLKDAWHSVSGS